MNNNIYIAKNLAILTIVYNLAEGFFSILFGAEEETLALFGFGLDSFVEVISGIGILHMILRMQKNSVEQRDNFERTALKITGISFYILTAGLILGSILKIIYNQKPESTVVGIIISIISILTMYFLMRKKLKVGKALNSDAIIADANCTKTCFYLSFVLLFSSAAYEIFQVGYLDILGSIGIAYFSFKEGKEAIEKSKSASITCSCNCH